MQGLLEFFVPPSCRPTDESSRLGLVLAVFLSGLMSVACATDFEPTPNVSQKVQGQTVAAQVDLSLPVSVDLANTVVSTQTQLWVRDGVIVSSPSPTTVVNVGTALTDVYADAVLGSTAQPISVIARGNVTLRDRTRITGSLTAGGTLQRPASAVIGGPVLTNQSVLTSVRSLPLTMTMSETTVRIDTGQQRTLAPGGYGNVTVSSNARLRLSSGVYTFKSFEAQATSTTQLIDATGPVVLQIRERMTYRGSLVGQDIGRRLLLIGTGTQDWVVDGPYQGTIIHPKGRLVMSPVNGTGHRGSFHAKQLELGARSPITFVPFQHWLDVFKPSLTAACRVESGDGTLTAMFTVKNPTTLAVAPGATNSISPSSLRDSSAIWAGPGKQQRFFTSAGEPIAWTLSGQTMTVTATSPLCAPTAACPQASVVCDDSQDGSHRHTRATMNATGGIFVADLDVWLNETDPNSYERTINVTKNGVLTFSSSTRRLDEVTTETLITTASTQGSSTFSTQVKQDGKWQGTLNGAAFGPSSLGASEMFPFADSQVKADAQTMAVLPCLLGQLAEEDATCSVQQLRVAGAQALAGDEIDGGRRSQTYLSSDCDTCKMSAGASATVAVAACAIASSAATIFYGVAFGICLAGVAGAEALAMHICDITACCPETCGASRPGDCCFSNESCLHKDKGLCCEAGKAPCGPIDHGAECCSASEICLNWGGSPRHDTCCDAASACGASCCDDRGVTLLPYGPSLCVDLAASKCCPEDLACGSECCSPNDNCISGQCVPRDGDCVSCGTRADCFRAELPNLNWCYKERDAPTGCCGVLVK